jgi:eukaryotic-like serine/threonine-protein kinase
MHTDRTPAERRAAEIIQSWLDGAPPDAAGALARHPEFTTDKAIVLDLAFAEFLVRELKGEQLDMEEYCARFPEYHASLGRMLAQQSVGERTGSTDGALPCGLADRTVNVQVHPVQVTNFDTSRLPSSANSPATPLVAGSGSSVSKRGGPSWPEPGGKVGDFNLLRQLGKGAFGRVFLALEEPTTRHVVVKISRQKCDEAKVLGRLGHRNVVAVLSAPRDLLSGLYLIVMPYDGSSTFEDLLELAYPLRKGGADRPKSARVIIEAAHRNLQPADPVPSDQKADPFLERAGFIDGVVWLGVRLADALSAVHSSGFVHHDLKPSNVLLGLDGQPRLLDFNLASDARNAKSRLGGTLPYMPPEHLQAVREHDSKKSMDTRGDVYSLGVILYELLTGTHPFGRFPKSRSVRTVAEEMLARQRLGVRPVRERNPDVPPRLARLVESCLKFDPADRPQTAAEVAAELRHCYSAKKRAAQFLGSRSGRAVITAAAIGLFSAVTWLATAEARPAPADHRRAGMVAFADGRYADAVPLLQNAARIAPDDGDVWLNIGRAKLAQGEWLSARPDLERAAKLRPEHGPTQATLGWCLAKLGHHDLAQAALAKAERSDFKPAGLYALRGFSYVQVRDDAEAATALDKALELDPSNRVALINRSQLALIQAMGRIEAPGQQAFDDIEKALTAGPADGNVYLMAARFYAWAAYKPPFGKGDWPDPAAMRVRCLSLLRLAVEYGAPDIQWKHDSSLGFVLGEPETYAKDWVRPGREASPFGYWRAGDPLVEFPG